jgi:polysaccharide export outer membrane protein
VNALEALAIAGGPSEFANTNGARVIRKAGDRLFVVPVRIGDALRGDLVNPNGLPRIESGDTLVIP